MLYGPTAAILNDLVNCKHTVQQSNLINKWAVDSERQRPKMQGAGIFCKYQLQTLLRECREACKTSVSSAAHRNGNCHLQHPTVGVATWYVCWRKANRDVCWKTLFPRGCIQYVFYLTKDVLLFSAAWVDFLRSFPVWKVQAKSVSLAMVEVKRNIIRN